MICCYYYVSVMLIICCCIKYSYSTSLICVKIVMYEKYAEFLSTCILLALMHGNAHKHVHH
jgi:hypothetical protein